MFAWAWWRGFLSLVLLDVAATPLALGYAIGRVGCQLSGDGDYGSASDLPWAMSYPDGTVPTDEQVHPTPVYETLAMGLIAWLLWRWRDRLPARDAVRRSTWCCRDSSASWWSSCAATTKLSAGLTAPQIESLVRWIASQRRLRTGWARRCASTQAATTPMCLH